MGYAARAKKRFNCEGTRDEDLADALTKKDAAQAFVLNSLKARINAVRGGSV